MNYVNKIFAYLKNRVLAHNRFIKRSIEEAKLEEILKIAFHV